MRTILTAVIVTALAVPAAAQSVADEVRGQLQRDAREITREIQRLQQSQSQQERDRQREQRQQEQERAQQERDRQRERAQQERDRIRESQSGPQQTERIARTLKLGANGELDLANVAGDITITRGTGNDVSLEVIKTARGRTDDDAKDMLQLVQVDITERAGRVDVKTRYPDSDEMRRNGRRNINVNVVYNVTAPAGTRIRAHSISGSVIARDIKGDLSLDSVSGNVRVTNGGRIGTAKSISGNVEISETDTDGALAASTVSGNVNLRRVKARQLEIGSISGNVVLDDVDSPRIEGQSVSGEVRFAGPIQRSARYELTSHSGSVQVVVAGGAGFEVEATSFSGSVRSDLQLESTGAGGPGRRNRSLRGVFGDGSAVLDLTTFSGNIVISKR